MKAHAQFRLALGVAAGLLGPSPSAWANYPERPVRIVVGFGAGSAADLAARIVGEELGRTMGQHFIVENRPGAGSNTAAVSVAKGMPMATRSCLAQWQTPSRVSSVNLMKDLKPIALICSLPNILVVHPSVKATTVQELIALAKAEPGILNYGSAGAGTSLHLSAELFKNMAGSNMVHVPLYWFSAGYAGSHCRAIAGDVFTGFYCVAADRSWKSASARLE